LLGFETVQPGLECAEDQLFGLVHREDQNFGFGQNFLICLVASIPFNSGMATQDNDIRTKDV
jgi:hypothetical protein